MRIFYYQRGDRQPNFGDDLNRWLWPQLRPDLFKSDNHQSSTPDRTTADSIFVGTGTLLNNKLAGRLEPAKRVAIFSTGAGYEQPLRKIPSSWKIYCVRGPLSAKQLGLPPQKAIADGGLLVASVFTPTGSQPPSTDSFMPHIHSAVAASDSWQRICQQANMRYIDPRWPIKQILSAIKGSQRLLTEAMHGAIVADALRVPWYPMVTMPRIYAFKWQDWCASMALSYQPQHLPPLSSYPRWGRGLRSGAVAARHWLKAGIQSPISTVQSQLSGGEEAVAKRLIAIANEPPYLSADKTLTQKLERLQTCLSKVR